jgi:glycosyltransferase involved in cell wall biosynthesis
MFDILVISDDVVGKKMAGPGIRAWEISRSLSQKFKVLLAVPDYSFREKDGVFLKNIPFDVEYYNLQDQERIQSLSRSTKIILTQGYILSKFPALLQQPAHLILDMYIPYPIENMFIYQWKIPRLKDREAMHIHDLSVFNEQLLHGDHFLAASPRQRDLLVGALTSLNRINPEFLEYNLSLEELIQIIPFGISQNTSAGTKTPVLRSRFPGINQDDILFIWGGVLSNWFDPITLIKAFSQAVKENPRCKLFFMSTKHANPLLPEFDVAQEAMQLSGQLGLTGTSVFFNHDWIDYDDLPQYFMDADIGVSIHQTHFETYFSFRTRILDYMKYNLPILCTEGDYFAELVKKKNLGITVGSENQTELKNAILNLADNRQQRTQIKNNIEREKQKYDWNRVTQPLIDYCERVLAGEIKNKKSPGPDELKTIFFQKRDFFPRRMNKKYFGGLVHKLPLTVSAKLKRLIKFFSS